MDQETKWLFRVKAGLLLMLIPTFAVACDICGCFIGILPYDNQSSIGIMHRYRVFNGYTGLPQQGQFFPSGAYRIPGPLPTVQHGNANEPVRMISDFESYKVVELRGKWFIHPRVELNFILPFVENRSSYDAVKERVDGLGDISLFAGYHLIKKTDVDAKFRHRLVVGMGVRLPAGKYNLTGTDGSRISVLMQPGTGSTAGLAYLAYSGGGKNFRWGATLTGKCCGTNRYGEQVSPSTANTAFAAYIFRVHSWQIMPQAQVYQEFMRGVWINNELQAGTGMNLVLAGPCVDLFRKNFDITMGIQFPVHEKTAVYDPECRGRFQVGVTYGFNQEKYLLHPKKKNSNN